MNKLEILKAKVNYHKNFSNQTIMICVPFIVTSYVLANQNKSLSLISLLAGIGFLLIYIYYQIKYHKKYKELIDYLRK